MKNCSNSLYDIRKKDSSFAGKNLLENTRIKAFIVDIRSALNKYKTRIGNTSDRTHNYGDHLKCKLSDVCWLRQIKEANPTWSDEKVHKEYAKDAI